MRITSKGQVTIPIAIREKAGLMPNTEVDFDFDAHCVRIRRARRSRRRNGGQALIARMRGRGDVKMTTDEIKALTRGE